MFSNMKRRYFYDPKDKNQSFTSILVALTKARIGEPGTHSTKAKGTQAEQQPILCVPESQSWQNGCQLAAFIRCQTASTKNNTSSYGFWYRGRTLIKSGQRPLDRNPSWLLLASKRGKLRVVCVESLVNLMLISAQTHPISIPLNNPKPILIIRFKFLLIKMEYFFQTTFQYHFKQ